MKINSEDLIRLIVWYASSRGEKLTTLRLVKFLYLADLYHARVSWFDSAHHDPEHVEGSKGTTLTGWPWAFVHFGPYCQEAMSAIDRAGKNDSFQVNPFDTPPTGRGLLRVDGERHTNNLTPCTARGMSRTVNEQPSKYDDEKDYRLFWTEAVDEEPEIISRLDLSVWSKLQWAIQRWADDSSGLLDYVYFETEPMIDAKPGEILDFGKARMPDPPKKIQMKKLSKKKVEEAKKAINELKERYKKAITLRPAQGPIDPLYLKAVRQLEGEALPEDAKIAKS